MALPYKVFKSLTIDGETMGVDTTVGTVSGYNTTTAVNIPNNLTYTDLLSFNLEENSLYFIQINVGFGAASATGQTWHNFALKLNGSNAFSDTELHSSNEPQVRNSSVGFKTGNSPVTLTLAAASNRALAASGQVWVYKLLSYVGG